MALPYFWNPPPEPDKPPCPYTPGFSVDIVQHLPPPPFGNRSYGLGDWPNVSMKWLLSVTQTKHVLHYPPLEAKSTPASFTPKKAKISITKAIAVEDARGAQIAVCLVTPQTNEADSKPYLAVAKIFDPLYYSFPGKIAYSIPDDVSFEADSDYSREAAAYEHLEAAGQTGAFAPAYYGSWTFTLPIRDEGVLQERHVRLLLIEHLDGACMRDLLCDDSGALYVSYDKSYRLAVLAKIFEGLVRQRHSGISQKDLAPRNIMLVPRPQDTTEPQPAPRVVLIDYNIAVVHARSREKEIYKSIATKLPRSPLDWYWTGDFVEFHAWTPPEWRTTGSRRDTQEWLLGEFGGEKAAMYEPPTRELILDPPMGPQDDGSLRMLFGEQGGS